MIAEGKNKLLDFLQKLDQWGLKMGLKDDVYTINNISPGTLIEVLTQKAIKVGTNEAYEDLREYAEIIETASFNQSLWGR